MNKTIASFITVIATVVCTLIASVVYAGASFAVAPGRVKLSLNHPSTNTFLIRNTSSQLIHLRVKPIFIPIQSSSLRAGTPLSARAERQQSLLPYLLVSPEALSLRPGEQREVRVSVRPPAKLMPGTYRAHVLVKMLEIAHTYRTLTKNKSNQNIATQLNMLMEMAVAVYGNVGQPRPQLQAICQRTDTGKLHLTLINTSPWHYDGKIAVINNQQVLSRFTARLYRQSKRRWTLSVATRPQQQLTVMWFSKHHAQQRTVCRVSSQ